MVWFVFLQSGLVVFVLFVFLLSGLVVLFCFQQSGPVVFVFLQSGLVVFGWFCFSAVRTGCVWLVLFFCCQDWLCLVSVDSAGLVEQTT